MSDDIKARLQRFYTKWNPEKLNTVDDTVKRFAGREEVLFATLVQKYGPEPGAGGDASPASPASPSSPSGLGAGSASGVDWVKRLRKFYGKHAPAKLDGVEQTVARFAGKHDAMWAALCNKYNVDPNEWRDDDDGGSPTGGGGGGGAGGDVDWHTRFTRLYLFHGKQDKAAPASVTATLARFKGKEQAALAALIQKYGEEPPADWQPGASAAASPASPASPSGAPAAATSVAAAGAEGDWAKRLEVFYAHYAKDKLAQLPATLERFKGREATALMPALEAKYGPESVAVAAAAKAAGGSGGASPASPTMASPAAAAATSSSSSGGGGGGGAPVSFKSRLARFYSARCPEKLPKLDDHVAKYESRQDDYMSALVQKFGPEPSADPPAKDYESRLRSLYSAYAPDKLGKIQDQLAKYSGREEALIQVVVAKYGPEPSSRANTPSSPSLPAAPVQQQQSQQQPAAPLSHRERVAAIYDKYAPDKKAKLDATMDKYKNREEELIAALVNKYGPEPKPAVVAEKQSAPTPTDAAGDNSNEQQQSSNKERKLAAAPEKPAVDPVQTIIQNTLTSLPASDAAALSSVANTPAFLNLIKNVAGSLGGGVLTQSTEQRVKALAEQEEEARDLMGRIEADEYGILAHMQSVAHAKISSAEESETLQRKSNDALRALYFELWATFAKNRLKARRAETLASLTPYQRVAFSKSGMKKYQQATSPQSPRSGGGLNSSSGVIMLSPPSGGKSPMRSRSAGQQHHNTSGASLFASASSAMHTPRTAAAPTPRQNMSSSSARGNVTPRAGSSRPGSSGVGPIKALNTIATGERGRSDFHSVSPATSRHEMAKSRHAVEARVEKLSDNQLKSLHRRLEKWGLPVPGFLSNVVSTRGLVTPAPTPRGGGGGMMTSTGRPQGSGSARSSTSRDNNDHIKGFGGFGRYAGRAAADGDQDTSELDATVIKVLGDMQSIPTGAFEQE